MASAPKDASYFQDKRGEINDLKNLLKDIHVERDAKKKREVIRKVIAFDTLGYDCSKLLPFLVIAASTSDIVVKKMSYQFLSHYARVNEELATLCVNTLTKDCTDADPMVRGLAIRALSSLRLKSTVEYLVPLITRALNDSSGYVRRNGVVAVLKVFYLEVEPGMLDPLLAKLNALVFGDRDTQVVSAAIQTLDEVYREASGGLVCDLKLFRLLLGRIQEFNEWEMCTALHVLARYTPTNKDDMFNAMNVLDHCLKQTNSAVVLACSKIFSLYAELVPDLKTSVYYRLKEPLLTLMLTSNSMVELKYTTLCHIKLLVEESSVVFEDSFKAFYLKHDEPHYVKKIKLDILPKLANLDNYEEILLELSEYALDVNVGQARQAVGSIAKIALQLGRDGPVAADVVLFKLLEFLHEDESSEEQDRIGEQVLDAFRDILQVFPDKAELIIQALPKFVLREQENSSSAIWMLGEFGAQLEVAPYLLERLVDRVDKIKSSACKSELLTAMLKLFFKQRALEVRPSLERLFRVLLNDPDSDLDLHDRAMFYYRLLKQDVFKAAEIVNASLSREGARASGEGEATGKFNEFNTLSVVYGKKSGQFIDPSHIFAPQQAPPPSAPVADNQPTQDEELSPYHAEFELSQQAFQQQWMNGIPTVTYAMQHTKPKLQVAQVEALLLQQHVKCMASGAAGPALFKFYFYAQSDEGVFLAEVLVENAVNVDIRVKTTLGPELAEEFASDLLFWM